MRDCMGSVPLINLEPLILLDGEAEGVPGGDLKLDRWRHSRQFLTADVQTVTKNKMTCQGQ